MAATNPVQPDVLADIEARTPESLHPVLEAAFKYRKQLIAAVCVILVVTAAYAGFKAYNSSTTATAQEKLGDILVSATGADRLAKLEAMLGDVPSSVRPAVTLEAAQTAMTMGEYAKAEGYWNDLIGLTDGEMKFVARLGKAKAMTLAGHGADALKEMKALAQEASEAYTVPVYRQLALAAEAAGDKAEALAAYKKLDSEKIGDKPFIEYKISQLENE
ncbi:transcriptional regulator [Pseudodesulfovibrio thermohalotolerans]|jgi:predicted negative regulator of RcsB-dependent stress response|uniref:tetratricopeptide repeat protein n=1 Tax=Pseudodesulfovibrio thermohalotolerans TaxID=2880651 RepID=UPI00244238D4|nr:tetratricopeptide repeat protein [Pseudodesulfovibrio thermohalotolerans]WFS63574.1 transcriptional regulator [Pseudodesulfovibrio thermohalotolerans]